MEDRAKDGEPGRRAQAAARCWRGSSTACCSSGPETGYRVLQVSAAGERMPVVVVGVLPAGRPGRADPGRGRLVRRPQLGPAVPRHRGDAGGARQRGRARGLPRPRAGSRASARSWPSGWSASSALRLGEVIEREPLRLREVEGVGPQAREPAAGGLGGPAPGARHARVPGRAGLQPGPRQPHRRGLWPGRHPDHPQGSLRAGPRHPRHRLRHRRPGGAEAGGRAGFGAADRCRHGRGAARGGRRRRHRPAAGRCQGAAGRAAGRIAGDRRRRDRARAPGGPAGPASS